LLNEALKLALAGLAVAEPLEPSCWIKVCKEEAKLPSYCPAVPEPPAAALDATPGVAGAPVALDAVLLPSPSDFRAANKECRKLCAACAGLSGVLAATVAAGAVAAVPAAVAALGLAALGLAAVVVAAGVMAATVAGAAVVPVPAVAAAGVRNETAVEAIGLVATTTCSSVDSRLLNNPWFVDDVWPDVPEVDSVPESVVASFSTDFLCPWRWKLTMGAVDAAGVLAVALNDMMAPR
jgi:hypothetical protein